MAAVIDAVARLEEVDVDENPGKRDHSQDTNKRRDCQNGAGAVALPCRALQRDDDAPIFPYTRYDGEQSQQDQ
jgi:hypothetical protein